MLNSAESSRLRTAHRVTTDTATAINRGLLVFKKKLACLTQTKRSSGIACLLIDKLIRRPRRMIIGHCGRLPQPVSVDWPLLLLLTLELTAISRAHATDAITIDLALIPDDSSLWKESLLWYKDIVVRAGVGYKDNVLLSPHTRQGSGFVTSGLDFSLIRLPLDGWEVNIAAICDDVRYFRNPLVLKGEYLFL